MPTRHQVLRSASYFAGIVYILFSTILLYIFTQYIISNLISLARTGEVSTAEEISAIDNFVFDAIILIFFFSSISYTISQLLVYMFPEIKSKKDDGISFQSTPYNVVLQISTEDEVTVIEKIKELAPRAYKFEIARATGLSKMKIHRIINRLEQRDILSVVKVGRNSQISLQNWLLSN